VILYTGHGLQIYYNDPHLTDAFIDTRKTEEKDEEEEEEAYSESHNVFTERGRGGMDKKCTGLKFLRPCPLILLTIVGWRQSKPSLRIFVHTIKGKVNPCTGTEALYRPFGP
jgi:hypothetical protein